jgi:hypothetical protein
MSSNNFKARQWSGLLLRRLVPIVGAMLAIAATLGTVSASAAPVGLFVAGEKSEEVAKQPRLEAEKYTATVSGSSTTIPTFTLQGGVLGCQGLTLKESISAATTSLSAPPVFLLTCSLFGFPATIGSNGCEFVLHVDNAGPPYAGSFDLKCPAGKEGLVFWGYGAGTLKCTVTILPQTGLEGVTLENTGTGSSRGITATYNLSNVAYTQTPGTGLGKCAAGEFANGTFTVIEKFTASK